MAGVSRLLPIVRKKRLRRLKTSCRVVSTRLVCIVDASTSARWATAEEEDTARLLLADGADGFASCMLEGVES